MPGCVILVPANGSIEPSCEDSLRALERRGYEVRRVRGFAQIDLARNQMATDALAAGFHETMWIDSDIGFHPDDVERLRSHKLLICCGIYPKKGLRELACHVLPGTPRMVFGIEGDWPNSVSHQTRINHPKLPSPLPSPPIPFALKPVCYNSRIVLSFPG